MTAAERQNHKAVFKKINAVKHSRPRHKVNAVVEVQELVQRAGDVLAPVWPLKTFIACNPLQGLERYDFKEALAIGETWFSGAEQDEFASEVNRELIKWCQAFLDEGQATIRMPYEDKGFYEAWRLLAPYDKKIHKGVKLRKDKLQDLPPCPADAITHCLKKLSLPSHKRESYFRFCFSQLPGWGGYIKWKQEKKQGGIGLVDFLAVRLAITWTLSEEGALRNFQEPSAACFSEIKMQMIREQEDGFRKALYKKISCQAEKACVSSQKAKTAAQLVFCIDVRSEPFRRQVEAQGSYETYGFAGFFGLPVAIKKYDEDETSELCPVLISPAHTLQERADNAPQEVVERRRKRVSLGSKVKRIYQGLKYNFASPFALVETLGPWCGLWMASGTLTPKWSGKIRGTIKRFMAPDVPVKPDLDDPFQGIPLSKQVEYAASALRSMGMTEGFSDIVVFCGHRSSTLNNPHASSLDCGACGGNHGGRNARVLAHILNTEGVRKPLESQGIYIPKTTLFIGAEHDTTTDQVELFDSEAGPDHRDALNALKADLLEAGKANSLYRWSGTGVQTPAEASREAERRSCDWAEVRPEWGLARNAAFIVGPRQLTKGCDLEGRCFLHSYNPDHDTDGSILEGILTAPMVVAQWINMQYFFSTLNPAQYGSGSKITQNPFGKVGVMQGNGSDLMHGLPLQSVCSADGVAYHEPIRLQTFISAPLSRVKAIIEKHDCLQKLFFNGWVGLTVIENGNAYLLERNGDWRPYEPER